MKVTCKGQTPSVVIDSSTNGGSGHSKDGGAPYGKTHDPHDDKAVWLMAPNSSSQPQKHDIKFGKHGYYRAFMFYCIDLIYFVYVVLIDLILSGFRGHTLQSYYDRSKYKINQTYACF